MEVTSVEIDLKHDDDEVKGLANVTLDNLFVIKGLQIVNENEGVCVHFPRKKDVLNSGQPQLNDFQRYLQDVVLSRYQEAVGSL